MGYAQDPRLHYGVKLHFGNLDVDLDNSEHVQRARRPLLGKHELLTRCIFSGDGGELHGLKRSSIHIHAGSPRGSGEHEGLAKVPETLRFLAAVVCTIPEEIETYGGQPNKQAADLVTTFDPGRMIWNGYTGAAGWMFRQALEGVLGLRLEQNEIVLPANWQTPTDGLRVARVSRTSSPGFDSSRPVEGSKTRA
jgi:hypothetical protein